jgi:acyl-CoA reductase-like NAD-dependent aldehyde dehydrogenase
MEVNSPTGRGKLMFAAMSIMQQRIDDLAMTLTKEEGKILRESRGEVSGRSISWNLLPAKDAGCAGRRSRRSFPIPLSTQ